MPLSDVYALPADVVDEMYTHLCEEGHWTQRMEYYLLRILHVLASKENTSPPSMDELRFPSQSLLRDRQRRASGNLTEAESADIEARLTQYGVDKSRVKPIDPEHDGLHQQSRRRRPFYGTDA